MNRRRAVASLATLSLDPTVAATPAHTPTPTLPRALTLVVGFPPGGVTDLLARAVAQQLARRHGIVATVDNRPGAGGQLAAAAVRQAAADGTTLWCGDIGSFALNGSLYNRLGYDFGRDFAAVARLAVAPCLVVVPADSPVGTMAELVAAAGQRSLSVASQSTGSGGHLFAELLMREAGIALQHVPYRGSAPALNDLAAGRVDLLYDTLVTSMPWVRAGRLKALAFAHRSRSPQLPQVPTLREQGWHGIELLPWFGIAVRAATPQPLVQTLARTLVQAIVEDGALDELARQGLEPAALAADTFGSFIAAESARWGAVIRDRGIRLD